MAKPLELYSPEYAEVKATAGADIAAGILQSVGSMYVFPLVDVSSGDDYAGILKANKVNAEKAAVAVSVGEPAYYITANDNVSNVATGGVLIGTFAEDKLSGDSHVIVEFDGTLAYAKA